uniref:Uncharacterized protein n=1 Tax=Rhipicephalus appendiculatus TaxID=34631 RepID=A0A131YBT3_RHIAP
MLNHKRVYAYFLFFFFCITHCMNRGIASSSPPHWQKHNHMGRTIDPHAARASSGVGAFILRCALLRRCQNRSERVPCGYSQKRKPSALLFSP